MMQEATTRSHLWIGLGGAMHKGEHTRQEIIREAAPIFNRRGYDGAALSDLMKATGLEKGGIYRHFDSKEQLAAEAFDYACEETLHACIHDLDAIMNTVDRLKQLLANLWSAAALSTAVAPCWTPPSTPTWKFCSPRTRAQGFTRLAHLSCFDHPCWNKCARNSAEGRCAGARNSYHFCPRRSRHGVSSRAHGRKSSRHASPPG